MCLPIGFASHLTELALLGTLALRTRKVPEWDADPAYRAPWKLPNL
jgi:hypothetical protein